MSLIAMLQSFVLAVIKLHRHAVITIKTVARTQPDKTVTILNNGLDMTVRKTASSIYTDKVTTVRRGKSGREKQIEREKAAISFSYTDIR